MDFSTGFSTAVFTRNGGKRPHFPSLFRQACSFPHIPRVEKKLFHRNPQPQKRPFPCQADFHRKNHRYLGLVG